MAGDAATGAGADAGRGSAGEVFRVALLLGLTSFGGPIAHLGYFHREYVQRRRWLSEATYGDLVALSQFLPGPASSQIGIGVGLLRAGWLGAIAAWVGFTLPSAVALTAFALATTDVDLSGAGWVHGLKLAAVAIVALAVLSMWRALAPDAPRKVIAMAAATAMLLLQSAALQVVVIAVGGLVGWRVLSGLATPPEADIRSPVGQTTGLVLLAVFLVLLVGLPFAVALSHIEWVAVVDSFYRAGALVFGGGHVVLPLLDEAVVTPGWVSEDTFLAGYGAAQAVPGPLFTFAAFLGASLRPEPNGVGGALLALVAIFLPSFLLIGGALPFWERMRRLVAFRRGLAGTNAAVVGLLVAALYDPVWSSSVRGPVDVALVVLAVAALAARNAPPWLVVVALASAGQVVQWVSA